MTTPPDMLLMFNIAAQRPTRGGINAAYVRENSTGRSEAAVSLFRQVIVAMRSRTEDRSYQAEFDKFQPARLAAAIRDRLEAMADLADPGLEVGELRARQASLQSIRTQGGSRLAQEAVEKTDHFVAELVTSLRGALFSAYSMRPDQARTLAEQTRRALNGLTFPPLSQDSFVTLQRALASLQQVQSRRGQLMPTSLEYIASQLTAKAYAAFRDALAATAAELVEAAFRRAAAAIQTLCDEVTGRGAEFERRLQGVAQELDERQKKVAKEQHISRASVVKAIAGPDEKHVVAGMIAHAGCTDAGQLAARLLDAFEARLRQLAPEQCPYLDAATAPLADLVRGIAVGPLADAFDRVIDESLGGGHSLYELILRVGVESIAEFLYDRAAPTIHLGERDIEAFNVSPLQLTIVRMPPALGTRDPEIRESLVTALHAHGPCTIAEGAATDRTVTVVRLHVGFPIGIDTSNRSLLDRYLRSGARGHLPHLLGVVPESPLGGFIEQFTRLDHKTVPGEVRHGQS